MQLSKWSHAGSLCITLIVGSSSAYGQTAVDKADELFNKAIELSESGNFIEACPLLAESQKLDPRAGTIFAMADCEREAGKLASSVAHFKAYLSEYDAMKADVRKRHDQRANSAKGQIKILEPQLPALKFTFPGGIPGDFVLTRNGDVVDRIELDKDVPVDPGVQAIVLKVPGREDSEQRITLELKQKKTVDLEPGAIATNDEGDKPKINVRRTVGFVLLGTGAAGLVLGGVMGGVALGKKGIVEDHCKGLDCDPAGLDAVGSGRTFGNVSTIGIVAGGVLAAAGAVLVFTAPKTQPKTGFITGIGGTANRDGAFLSVEGQF